ncbi:MAG TPA: AAA family ATPase [Burkholderiaceae bacterium]|nr:AAA family ATPase [Burkholderiaceae bacterium]
MKLAISGTYSSGKTRTVMALAHYTGIPRTLAQTIREIMPAAVPGKTLAQCTPAEFLQLAMRRHVGRAVHEGSLPNGFISDGSSLQEWIYGAVRVLYGMDPSKTAHLKSIDYADLSEEMRFFDAVVDQYGHAFKQHVKGTFDAFVHLRNELPLTNDGHRPMNELFRATCDDMLLNTLTELDIPHYIIGGTIAERLNTIVDLFNFPTIMSVDEAINLAQQEYAKKDLRFENERAKIAA